jgi:HK97 family phage prohead protease
MKQTRFIPIGVCGLRVREAGEGEQSRTIEGTPIVFGVRSVNLTPWSETRAVYEVLEKGCITPELLQRSDVILNLNHSNMVPDVLGRFRNTDKDTLQLTLNEDNMECRCEMPHTNNADDTLELMKRGDITGMSFAFSDDYQDSENGVSYERTEERTADGKEVWLRHVKRITGLYDVSIVTHPAYEQTSVGTREASDAIDNAIDAQLKREQGETPKEKKAREERELEEQAERAREMQMHRLRSQRRHMNEKLINNL